MKAAFNRNWWFLLFITVLQVNAQHLVFTSGELIVNEITVGRQQSPDVAIDDAGKIFFVWSDGGKIKGRHLTVGGAFGNVFQLNNNTIPGIYPRIVNCGSDFAVIWQDQFGIELRRHNNMGIALGSPVLILDYTPAQPAMIASNRSGNFVVSATYQNFTNQSFFYELAYQRFNSSGLPITPWLQVEDRNLSPLLRGLDINALNQVAVSWQNDQWPAYYKYAVFNKFDLPFHSSKIDSAQQFGGGPIQLENSGNVKVQNYNPVFEGQLILYGMKTGTAFTDTLVVSDHDTWMPDVELNSQTQNMVVISHPNTARSKFKISYYYAGERINVPNEFSNYTNPTAPISYRGDAKVCLNIYGEGAVVWESYGQDGDQEGIYARTFRINHAPENIVLSKNTTTENLPPPTFIGLVSASDPDRRDNVSFSLAPGFGDLDNSLFEIRRDSLFAIQTLDFESKSTYAIRVRATDTGGLTVDKEFTIYLLDDPTDNTPTGSNTFRFVLDNHTILEGSEKGNMIGQFAIDSGSALAPVQFRLSVESVSNNNKSFRIEGNKLLANQTFTLAEQELYSIEVIAYDNKGVEVTAQFELHVISTTAGAGISVFPNPFATELILALPAQVAIGDFQVRIVDLLGRTVWRKSFWIPPREESVQYTLGLKNMNPGFYVLELTNYTKKWSFRILKTTTI